MYEQATIAAVHPEILGRLQAGLRATFAQPQAEKFLQSVARAGLRVRDFEVVLQRGLLERTAQVDYGALSGSDRGQIRELYLQLVERVSPELRKRFMKVYTYY